MNISLQTVTPITKRVLSTAKTAGKERIFFSAGSECEHIKTNNISFKKLIAKLIPSKKPKFDYIKMTKQTINNMKADYDTKVVFADFYKRILPFSKETKKAGYLVGEFAQKFEQIKHPEIKDIILVRLKDLNHKNNAKFFGSYKKELDFLTSMTDAVNSIDGCYSQVNNAPVRYYKSVKKKGSWLADAIEGVVKNSSEYNNKLITKKKSISYSEYLEKMEGAAKSKMPKTFENDIRLAPFREFLENYADKYPKTVKKVYNIAYLPTVEPNIRSVFTDIQKNYDCMVIASNGNMTYKDALYLKEEFDLFKEAGKDDALFPRVFDIDNLNTYLRIKNMAGVTKANEDQIIVRDLLSYDAKNNGQTVRHELIHENSEYDEIDSFKGIIKGILDWKKQIFKNKKIIRKELQTAGLTSEKAQNYGMSKKWELGAVSMEAEHPEKYTEEFKEFLKQKCFTKNWFFEIKPNKYKIAQEENRVKRIQESFNN